MTLKELQALIKKSKNENGLINICRQHFLNGTPHVFKNKEDEYYKFRKIIADHFGISYREVYITGSAKLGFSMLKKKEFDLNSDIDIAIASPKLYEYFQDATCIFQWKLRKKQVVLTATEMKQYELFLKYLAIGWMRPDKLPISLHSDFTKDKWDDFFTSISYGKSSVGNYKVAAGVYKSHEHLESYICFGLSKV